MNVVIVFDSSTGTTKKAAKEMGKLLSEQGHQCQVLPLYDADPASIAEADLLCVGSWVKGLFIIRQHPTEGIMQFIDRLDDLAGKKTVVFCTYKIAIGSTLHQMTKALEAKGGQVVAQFKYRGPETNSKFVSFAASFT
jgi:flavodoxin